FIFSVGISPADAAAALAAVRVLRREPERVQRLQARAAEFRRAASRAGLGGSPGDPSPIVPIVIGDQHRCMEISLRLLAAGVHVQPVIFPAVARTEAQLRFFLTSEHSPDQIRVAIECLAEAVRETSRASLPA
ncbi:MAG: aminotransferase class I/II-fold pyridoxal phosphate-dependent enzyme, partial [Pseudomonadota bacterium]